MRHELELIDIEMAETLAEGKGRLASLVCQFTR
jgi:hypothetical protein